MKVLVIAVVAIIVIGGGYFVYSNMNGQEQNVQNQRQQDNNMMVDKDKQTSVAALMMAGQPVTCTYTFDDESGSQSGTVYLDTAGERMRGNFHMTQSNGDSWDGYVIKDSEWLYSWGGPFGNQGTKIKISATETDADTDDQNSEQTFDENKEADYDCSSWSVESQMFVPPSDIQFQDLSETMMQIQEMTTDVSDVKCGACDQVPDEASRDACRQALGC